MLLIFLTKTFLNICILDISKMSKIDFFKIVFTKKNDKKSTYYNIVGPIIKLEKKAKTINFFQYFYKQFRGFFCYHYIS